MSHNLTSKKISDEIIYGCISHVPIQIDYPEFVKPIYLGDSCFLGDLNLNILAPKWVKHHPIIGGLAGSFALKNYINNNKTTQKFVGICQYRKFLSHTKLGKTADNYQVMDITSNDTLDKKSLTSAMIPEKLRPLLCQPGQFLHNGKNYNYLYQYKDVHHIEDLLRFTAQLIERKVIDKEEAYLFLTEEIFVPGGIELGILPIDFWLSNITKLEEVVLDCISLFPDKREGYQARAWAFCMERIGSFLLMKEFRKDPNWIEKYCGCLNLINDDNSYSYAPGL